MDNKSSGIDFAIIGHQESWEQVQKFLLSMRDVKQLGEVPLSSIKEIFDFIPPRSMFGFEVKSATGSVVRGAYIETFISPDALNIKQVTANIKKVVDACHVAVKLGAKVVSLGGFTSIVLEMANSEVSKIEDTYFTTGNTLTSSFICLGVEAACNRFGKDLKDCQVLIIGSTGDIGSACVRYLGDKVEKLLLCARQSARLNRQSKSLSSKNILNVASTHLPDLFPHADVIISVASSQLHDWNVSLLKDDVIICDAGYPKNINTVLPDHIYKRLFLGGMGQVQSGFTIIDDCAKSFYEFPVNNVIHGCLLEAIVLSMEGCPTSFSKGRGNITIEAINKLTSMAASHGIFTAPFFNHHNQWQQPSSQKIATYA